MSVTRGISTSVFWCVAVAGLLCVGQVAYGDIARPDQAGNDAKQVMPEKEANPVESPIAGGPPADWFEDWEAYANGSSMHGQGGWQGWDNDPTWTGYLQEVIYQSFDSALESAASTDLVHPFSGHTSGVWNLYAYIYVPTGLSAPNGQYFIVEKEYNDGGPYQWSIQMWVATDGSVHCDCGAADNGTPGVTWIADAWNEIHAIIDLDTDWVELWFNDWMLGSYQWTTGVFGGDSGCPAGGCIGAIDLFAYDGTSVYFDDLSLTMKPCVPETEVCTDGVDNDCDDLVDCDDADCDTDPACLPVPGACCPPDLVCVPATDVECAALDGVFYPYGDCANIDCAAVIPTVSEWGLVALTVVLLGCGALVIVRRQRLAA